MLFLLSVYFIIYLFYHLLFIYLFIYYFIYYLFHLLLFIAMQIGGGSDLLSTTDINAEEQADDETHIFEKHDYLLHGKKSKDRK